MSDAAASSGLRVLLTGAGGLIGPHLAAALQEAGHEVVTVGRGAGNDIRADLLDPAARSDAVRQARASHLAHLAWHADPLTRWHAPENLDWAAATIALVRGFAAEGGRRALCAGSCAEYDWSPAALGPEGVLREDSPLAAASLYGRAKAATGTLLTGATGALGLSLAWGRIFFCYGPDEAPGRLLSDLVSGLCAGERVACTDGLQERDFLYTPDLGAALAAVLLSDFDGPVNIGSGTATPVRAMIEHVARLMGRPDLIDLGARRRPADDPPVIRADTTRLASTGWRPAFDLGVGLEHCLRAQGVLPREDGTP